jgi:hypothetical protein
VSFTSEYLQVHLLIWAVLARMGLKRELEANGSVTQSLLDMGWSDLDT